MKQLAISGARHSDAALGNSGHWLYRLHGNVETAIVQNIPVTKISLLLPKIANKREKIPVEKATLINTVFTLLAASGTETFTMLAIKAVKMCQPAG